MNSNGQRIPRCTGKLVIVQWYQREGRASVEHSMKTASSGTWMSAASQAGSFLLATEYLMPVGFVERHFWSSTCRARNNQPSGEGTWWYAAAQLSLDLEKEERLLGCAGGRYLCRCLESLCRSLNWEEKTL